MMRRLFYPDAPVKVGVEADEEDASSVGSDWTQVSMGSHHSPNTTGDDRDVDLPVERRDSLSTTHSGEFARVTDAYGTSESDVDYSTDEDVLEGEEVDIAIESSDCTQSDTEDEETRDDILVVERSDVENVLDDGTQYKVDSERVATLFDALSKNVNVRRVGDVQQREEERHTEQEWTDESDTESEGLPVDWTAQSVENSHNYRHTLNNKLTSHLTIVAVVAVAIGVGVGIGHFVGTTHNSWIKRNKLQRDQLEQVRSLEMKFTACLNDMSTATLPLKSELVEYRTKLTVCQTARHTCSASDKPTTCGCQPSSSNNLSTNAVRQIESMRSNQRALISSLKKISQEANALRSDLRVCRMGQAEPKESPSNKTSSIPSTSTEDALLNSLVQLASNMTTAVQSMVRVASSETGRVSAAPKLLRLIGRVAEKTMVTAVSRVWNKANTMLQEHRQFSFGESADCQHEHFASFVMKGAQHFQNVIDSLPPLLTYENDFDLELDDEIENEVDNFTFAATPTQKVEAAAFKPMSRSDVYRLRKMIKRSPLQSLIGSDHAHAYLARLKPLTGRSTAPFTPRQQQWLTCQQQWWTNGLTNVCHADDLTQWQSSSAVSFTDIIAMPWVENMVAEWQKPSIQPSTAVCVEDDEAACESATVPVCPYKVQAPEPTWMFSRAEQRNKARTMQERQDWYSNRYANREARRAAERQSDWLFERQHHREHARTQHKKSPKNRTMGEHLRSTWRRAERTYGKHVKSVLRKVDKMF